MWLTALWNLDTQHLQWGVAAGASLVGAFVDISTRRIPNWLTAPVALTGLAWATWQAGLGGLADSAAACTALMLPFMVLFALAGGGAGDAKLMAAMGCWLGLANGLAALAGVAAAGLIMAVGYSLARRNMTKVLLNLRGIVLGTVYLFVRRGPLREARDLVDQTQMKKMPYAPAIFVGVCVAGTGVCLWRG